MYSKLVKQDVLNTARLTNLPNLMASFETFGALSNLKIKYYSKYYTLNLNLPDESIIQCQQEFSFTWKHISAEYLWKQPPANLIGLYSLNHCY